MPLIAPGDARFSIYSKKIDRNLVKGTYHDAQYYMANLALEELKARTDTGVEPCEADFDHVKGKFDDAISSTNASEVFDYLRMNLLRAWIRPVVWSNIINIDGLTNRQARVVAENVGLEQAGNESASILSEALAYYDDAKVTPIKCRSEEDAARVDQLSGFLNEATLIQLGVRHNTAKQFAVPSAAFHDRLSPDRSLRIDGFYYDNRNVLTDVREYPYQVEGISGHAHIHVNPRIPIINALTLGNVTKKSTWPNDNRTFVTARRLVTERNGKRVGPDTKSRLDGIASKVFNRIKAHESTLKK